MGDRYYLDVICSSCGHKESNVYYAPTSGFISWECPECSTMIDLGIYSGISYEDCSNREMIEHICDGIKKGG